jgi:lipopolysaccharide transport system ATP-binding protein
MLHVRNLGKTYQIDAERPEFTTLIETLTNSVKTPYRRVQALLSGKTNKATDQTRTFWALQEINFDLYRGEVLGVIGRNGAGKSTLLKILSRITTPTTGRVDVYGKVGALLEVGTGFHHELTGRENIYLNGSILGMNKREIERYFDEIVDFAGIEPFLDTPVKHYSSGMRLRLGFSVAAHLDSEILLIDEVLAVGDAEFQRKCLGKMSDVAYSGRTVIFVSHNMLAVNQLCSRALLLEGGVVTLDDTAAEVTKSYVASTLHHTSSSVDLSNRMDRHGAGHLRFTRITLFSQHREQRHYFSTDDPLIMQVEYAADGVLDGVNFDLAIRIDDVHSIPVFTVSTEFIAEDFIVQAPHGEQQCHIPALPLLPGEYSIHLWCKAAQEEQDYLSQTITFTVVPPENTPGTLFPKQGKHGMVFVPHAWAPRD